MILPFMPEGAHVILLNYMTQERGKRVARAAAAEGAEGAEGAAGLPALRGLPPLRGLLAALSRCRCEIWDREMASSLARSSRSAVVAWVGLWSGLGLGLGSGLG